MIQMVGNFISNKEVVIKNMYWNQGETNKSDQK